MAHRIVFTFDDRSLATLKQIQTLGEFGSMAEVVRAALTTFSSLQRQGFQGFNEVLVRNPDTKDERWLEIPDLKR